MASDRPFYNIFAPQKVPLSKISDDIIAYDLCFAPLPPIKNSGNAYGCTPIVIIGSKVCVCLGSEYLWVMKINFVGVA